MSRLKFLDNGAKVPRVTRRVELGEYHKALEGDYIDVWVNLPRRLSNLRLELAQDAVAIGQLELGDERDERLAALNEKMLGFHSEWWDLPIEQTTELYEVDTTLYNWIVTRAAKHRGDYEDERKKVDDDSTDT
jgi:hypothetical protein